MKLAPRPGTSAATWAVLAGVVAFALWRLGAVAAGVPLWYDELLTVRISEVGSAAELWRAISAGFDFNPPLVYVATKAARALPFADPLAARLPALVGFVLLVTGLYRWLSPRVGAWLGLAAVTLVPLAEYTVRYAVEARPYMLLAGVSAWALVCWQRLRDKPSTSAAVGLWALVVCALLLHVWAVLLVLALGVGELVATMQSRRLRWRVAVPIAAALPVLGVHVMLLRGTKTLVFENAAYLPSASKLSAAMVTAVPRLRVLLAVIAVAAIGGWLARRRASTTDGDGEALRGLFADERALLLACVLSPLVPYVYATFGRSAFMPRYAVYAMIGVVCLTADLLCGLVRATGWPRQAVAATAVAGLLLYLPPKTVPVVGTQTAVADALTNAPGLPDGVPVVLVNPIDVLTFEEHATEPWLSRTVYVADAAMARRYTGTDAIDLGYIRGEPYLRLRSKRLTYEDLSRHGRLLLVGKWQALTWLPQRLRDDGWQLARIGGSPQAPIYEALAPGRAP